SFERFRGPLTITLAEVIPNLRLLSPGQPVQIKSQSLSFPELEFAITFQGGEVWQPGGASALPSNDPERHARLVEAAKEVLQKKNGAGLSHILPPLLGLSEEHHAAGTIGIIDWKFIRELQIYLRKGEAGPSARLLGSLLGAGPGLTPSGDDFIIGCLLSLNRWQNSSWTSGELRGLNGTLVEAAYAKTTSLGANLIECATRGLANERLINALDWLVTGAAREAEIVTSLVDWGNSSGVDAFTGMVVTLVA
ncbi:MAG TPA: DUF2877 domain-containing protein, partial [Anaerolineales bacterium]|nr:DUF2877 domain-containing protein [Anaerolineales bacterium]